MGEALCFAVLSTGTFERLSEGGFDCHSVVKCYLGSKWNHYSVRVKPTDQMISSEISQRTKVSTGRSARAERLMRWRIAGALGLWPLSILRGSGSGRVISSDSSLLPTRSWVFQRVSVSQPVHHPSSSALIKPGRPNV